MKSDEVWSFDGFPWMQSGGPSYHCQRRSQQLMIDHHWLWLHIPTVSPYWMVEACCIFSPRVLLFFYLPCPRPKTCDLPGMFDHVSHLLALHLAARSRLRRLKRGNTDLRDICCKCPKKLLRWPWKEVSSILRQTHHSCCWQYTFCIYIYTTHTTHTHTSYPIIYPLFAIISPLHPLQNG